MILITITNSFLEISTSFNPLWLAGISGWLAALLLFSDTPRILQIQVGILLVVGLGLIFYSSSQGANIDMNSIISGNTGLLAMIAAVGFLKLVVIPDSATQSRLPVGKGTYLQTLIGLNLSSSIINISAPIPDFLRGSILVSFFRCNGGCTDVCEWCATTLDNYRGITIYDRGVPDSLF
jgi:hypothetical protein